jgi:ribosomal protein S20
VEAGDAGRADAEHTELVSRIDKAVKSGGLHRNNAARKKARAARLRARVS